MQDIQDNDLISKQKLIKSEIIDKNYDKSLFFKFCMERKPNDGDDLSNWTMEELVSVINDYVADENDKKEKIERKINENKKAQSLAESLNLNMEEIRNQRIETPQKGSYIKEIQCRILPPSIFNYKNVVVDVGNPKPVENGYFKPNFITYEVYTKIIPNKEIKKEDDNNNMEPGQSLNVNTIDSDSQYLVIRRYSDFVTYRQILCKVFPRILIPPMPGKKLGGRRFEIDFIKKRMNFLNKFINSVMENETLKAAEATVAFLTIKDRLQYEAKMKELNSIPPINYIEENKTLDGKIQIALDNDVKEQQFSNVITYFKLQNQILVALNDNLKEYYKKINSADESLAEVQKNFELLHLLNSKVQVKEDIIKSYEVFGKFFKNWRRIMLNQNEVIKKNVKDFFKFIKMEGDAYTELINSRENIKYYYEKDAEKLQKKKDKLWTSGDVTKWEILGNFENIDRALLLKDKDYACSKMCTAETVALENEKKKFGQANKGNIEELKKLLNNYCNRFTENIKEFADKLGPTITDSFNVWTSVASCLNQ